MEFDELQKIWDVQNNRPLYVINETALHNHIVSKKKKTDHITSISEWLLITVNFAAAGFVFWLNYFKSAGNVFMYIMAAWMFITGVYVLVSRNKRMNGQNKFDRSMLGDLHHAISTAAYQVRISQLMRLNIFPLGILAVLGILEGGKPLWIAALVSVFFIFAWYLSGWEDGIYKAKKNELEALRKKLITE